VRCIAVQPALPFPVLRGRGSTLPFTSTCGEAMRVASITLVGRKRVDACMIAPVPVCDRANLTWNRAPGGSSSVGLRVVIASRKTDTRYVFFHLVEHVNG